LFIITLMFLTFVLKENIQQKKLQRKQQQMPDYKKKN